MTLTQAPTQAPMQAPPSKTIRTLTVALNAFTFQAELHGTVADQADPLVGVCDNGHPPARIRRTDGCSSCGSAGSARKKAQVVGNALIVLDEEKLAAIQATDEKFKGVLNLSVVEAAPTSFVAAGSSYFLAPKGPGGANYSLIAALMRRRPKLAFLGEFSFGGAPKLFRLEVGDGNVLVLREVARPEAIRQRPQVAGERVDPRALALAEQLADALTEPFKPEKWINRHAKEVTDLIAATPVVSAATSSGPAGGDVLALLEASITAATAGKAPAPATKRRPPGKKATAAKAA